MARNVATQFPPDLEFQCSGVGWPGLSLAIGRDIKTPEGSIHLFFLKARRNSSLKSTDWTSLGPSIFLSFTSGTGSSFLIFLCIINTFEFLSTRGLKAQVSLGLQRPNCRKYLHFLGCLLLQFESMH